MPEPGAHHGGPAAWFTPAELAYLLDEPRLGRLATAHATGAPHVVPVGWSLNLELGTIDISGRNGNVALLDRFWGQSSESATLATWTTG